MRLGRPADGFSGQIQLPRYCRKIFIINNFFLFNTFVHKKKLCTKPCNIAAGKVYDKIPVSHNFFCLIDKYESHLHI
jgi:hypothetical protein